MKRFIVTYYRKSSDIRDCRVFKSLQELCDWFALQLELDPDTVIENIEEDTTNK